MESLYHICISVILALYFSHGWRVCWNSLQLRASSCGFLACHALTQLYLNAPHTPRDCHHLHHHYIILKSSMRSIQRHNLGLFFILNGRIFKELRDKKPAKLRNRCSIYGWHYVARPLCAQLRAQGFMSRYFSNYTQPLGSSSALGAEELLY